MKALTASPTRRRLHAEMARVLGADPGVYTSDPRSVPSEVYKRHLTWAHALMACHGADMAAGVYSAYAHTRQTSLISQHPGLSSWEQAAQAGIPVPEWHRDDHRFLCDLCPAFPVVVERAGGRKMCRVCARRYIDTPSQAVPLWVSHVQRALEFPGRSQDAKYQPDALVGIAFPDGEQRRYAAGEASLFLEQRTPLPGFQIITSSSNGPTRDRISLQGTVSAARDDRRVRISAVLDYDPAPDSEDLTPYPYGFRLRYARVTIPGAPAASTEHGDLHSLLAAALDHLYPASLPAGI